MFALRSFFEEDIHLEVEVEADFAIEICDLRKQQNFSFISLYMYTVENYSTCHVVGIHEYTHRN